MSWVSGSHLVNFWPIWSDGSKETHVAADIRYILPAAHTYGKGDMTLHNWPVIEAAWCPEAWLWCTTLIPSSDTSSRNAIVYVPFVATSNGWFVWKRSSVVQWLWPLTLVQGVFGSTLCKAVFWIMKTERKKLYLDCWETWLKYVLCYTNPTWCHFW